MLASSSSHHPSSFLIISYNILAQSLGSNCIPWVTRISDEWIQRLNNNNPSWPDIKSALGREYKASFHKNPYTQSDPKSYHHMRLLWSAKSLESKEELETMFPNLDRVKFHSKWKVSYQKKSKQDGMEEEEEEDGEWHTATTLGGVLQKELGETLGSELFQHLMELEDNVYDWKKSRGSKIFRRVTSDWTRNMAGSEKAEEEEEEEGVGIPSIVCLQEYDVHSFKADYRSHDNDTEEEEETFAQAMKMMGYDGIFFPGASGKSGLGTFWKRDEFGLDDDDTYSTENGEENEDRPDIIPLGANWRQAAFNYDLMEHYHDRSITSQQDTQSRTMLLNELDRKNVGFLRLKHVHSNRKLWVFNTHLMTTSRDNEKLTFYPGEMRAGELMTVSKLIQNHVNGGGSGDGGKEDVVLVGDWNTDVGNLDVLNGCISLIEKDGMADVLPPVLNIPTRFTTHIEKDCLSSNSQFDWRVLHSNSNKKDDEAENDIMGGAILMDAFEPVHGRRSHTVNPSKASSSSNSEGDEHQLKHQYCHATSQNSDRREWIDHVWYSGKTNDQNEMKDAAAQGAGVDEQHLRVRSLSNTQLPWKPIPDLEEPSDHIPIGAELEFRNG